MDYKEFKELIEHNFDNEYGNRRFEVVLDFEPAVYYDTELDTYWYCSEDDEELEEVELVGQLTFDDYDNLCPDMDMDGMCFELSDLIPNIFCGEESEGEDWLWFDVVDKDKKTPPLERMRIFH